jgi:hypothetical protein
MYARIKDNIVVEKTTLNPALYYSATASSWVPCPDDTALGATFDGTDTFTAPAPLPTPALRILEDEAAADAKCDELGIPRPGNRPENDTDPLIPPAPPEQ